MAADPKPKQLVRPAAKAGSWYTAQGNRLESELSVWLSNAQKTIDRPVKAIISPHAGYLYSGKTAAFAYKHINPKTTKRVFILGPDHCGSTRGNKKGLLSSATHWDTPFGQIAVDTKVVNELYSSGKFEKMDIKTDASEHSVELCVPYIAYVLRDVEFSIIPIVVGHCRAKMHSMFAQQLLPYFEDDSSVFVISSDFCHWGTHYNYKPMPPLVSSNNHSSNNHYSNGKMVKNGFDKASSSSTSSSSAKKSDNHSSNNNNNKKKKKKREFGAIWEYIEFLDECGMVCIENLSWQQFNDYLDETDNTICGQNPISILLHMANLSKLSKGLKMKFVDYSQSNRVKSADDFSVSYAAGVLSYNPITM